MKITLPACDCGSTEASWHGDRYGLRQYMCAKCWNDSQEVERLKNEILCACNAITDSVLCSGNDPATTLHFVRKLRAIATS